MIAKVTQTRSISASLLYDRAVGHEEEKGGEVVRTNCVPDYASPEVQRAMLEHYSSEKYAVKGFNIILSHSPEDSRRVRANPHLEKMFIHDFLEACRSNGVEIDSAPWVMTRHTNTDCLHYHMLLLSTRFDGKRLNAGYIGRKVSRAAMEASKKNSLSYGKGWDVRAERRKQYAAKGKQGAEKSEPKISLADRRKAIEAAKARKATIVRSIKQAAPIVEVSPELSKSLLEAASVSLMFEGGKWLASYTEEEKSWRYELDALVHGEVDSKTLDILKDAIVPNWRKSIIEASKSKTDILTVTSKPRTSAPSRGRQQLNQQGGASDTNREHEVGRNGYGEVDDERTQCSGWKM